MPIDTTGREDWAEPEEAPAQPAAHFGAGLIRPACHWLPGRMGAAALAPPAQAIAAIDHEPSCTETETDAERAAAIETLVALAAQIEAAQADAMPQFIYDPLAAVADHTGERASETYALAEEDAPWSGAETSSTGHEPRWGDALRSFYPEAALLLVAVALLGAWAYAALPHAAERKPGVAVAEIRADEAAQPGAPEAEDARLSFVGRESCGTAPCESLLTFTPGPALEARDASGSGVFYTTAAQPGTTQVSSPENAPSPRAEASAAVAQDGPSAVALAAGDAEPEAERIEAEAIATDPIKADPIKTEPVGSEPILAASEPAPASVEARADVAVATPPALEAKTSDVSEVQAISASGEPVATSAPILDVETLEKGTIASKPPEAGASAAAARPARSEKAGTAVHKPQPPQAAKKSAVAARAKPAGGVKIAVAKSTPKALPADKQTVGASPVASKAPGFQASTPSTSLFKPGQLKPALPAAVASKAPETPSVALNASPGDKPPGFEIQTNLGGGFFAFQPY